LLDGAYALDQRDCPVASEQFGLQGAPDGLGLGGFQARVSAVWLTASLRMFRGILAPCVDTGEMVSLRGLCQGRVNVPTSGVVLGGRAGFVVHG
jgi:hypothetical protein